jgi:hypothetical protein
VPVLPQRRIVVVVGSTDFCDVVKWMQAVHELVHSTRIVVDDAGKGQDTVVISSSEVDETRESVDVYENYIVVQLDQYIQRVPRVSQVVIVGVVF